MSEPRMRICPGCNATFGATEGHACATTVYAGQGAGHLAMNLLAQKAQEVDALKAERDNLFARLQRVTAERQEAWDSNAIGTDQLAAAKANIEKLLRCLDDANEVYAKTHRRAEAAERARDEAVLEKNATIDYWQRAFVKEKELRDEAVATLREIVDRAERDRFWWPEFARARAVLEGGQK